MVKEGLIYRDLKPVYWSPSSQSALAEAEVEYADHISPSLYVAFKVIEGNKYVENGDYLIIWTTTPWTLLANSGVAINDQFEYAKVLVNGNKYIIAKDLIESVAAVAKWEEYQVLSTFKGKEFLGIKYKNPITPLVGPVVFGHHVSLDTGTGLVHIAPLFGEDDFIIGKKKTLKWLCT